jgi:glyoxylase-like metal-dependent hydrolase (beta-lactamase superfamily II)
MTTEAPSLPIEPDALAATCAVHRIADDVWRIVAPNPSALTGPGTNTYVVGHVRPVVIDPGPADEEHLDRILGVCQRTPGRILCTHSHPDHSPGAAPLAKRIGAPVCGRPPPDDGHQDPTYAPQLVLDDGARIDAGDSSLLAIHTPGHASNHLCFLHESQRLLFTGDHLMSGSTVVIIPPDGSMRDYLISLARLSTLPLRSIAPGHGSRIPDAFAEIDKVVRHRLAREAKVVAALEARDIATLDELLPVVYDDLPVFMHAVARYSLLAHVQKLVEDGRVASDGGRYRWLGA